MRVWGLFAGGILLASACKATPPCAPSANGANAANAAGPRCMDAAHACPHDAERAASGSCACAPGLEVVDGACVSADDARAYCGATARWSSGSGARCVARTCGRGEALDTSDGSCVVTRALREMAQRDRLLIEPDETLG